MPSYTPPQGAGDALAAQSLYYLKGFTDWLATNSQTGKGMITEIGIPGSSNPGVDPIPCSGTGAKYDRRWNAVLHQWFLAANAANLHVTAWNASEWNVDLRAYRTDDGNNKAFNYRTTVSEVLEYSTNLSNGSYLRGVNYAGGEFSDRGPNGSLDRSHLSQPNAGYYYPHPGSFPILYSRGMRLIRIPIRWERVQPTLKQPLDTTEMAALDVSINAAIAAGCTVLLDVHNYSRYDTTPTGVNTNGVYNLGQNAPATHNGQTVGGTMTDCFADLWSKLATYYLSKPNVWFDIMNEPHDLPGGANDWKIASRAAVEAIRLVSPTVKIAIEGYSYSTVPDWVGQNGSTAWMTQTIPVGQTNAGSARNVDPNILWNGHHYLDPRTNGFDGGYQDTYADELAYAQSQGFSSWSTGGYVDPYPFNITSQTGLRTTFTSSFDSTSDFSGTYDGIIDVGQATLPYAGLGNPASSLKITSNTTSNESGIRKSLTGSLNARIIQFDFQLDSASTISAASNFCIAHFWDNNFTSDVAEIRILGSGSGYVMQINKTTTGYPTNTGTTVLSKGTWYTIKFEVTDTAFNLYVNGALEVTFTSTNTSVNVGGIALGKFYGTQAMTFYYDNLAAGINATYDAPPNGGYIAPIATVTTTNAQLLISD
jgi:hypothetical protein